MLHFECRRVVYHKICKNNSLIIIIVVIIYINIIMQILVGQLTCKRFTSDQLGLIYTKQNF